MPPDKEEEWTTPDEESLHQITLAVDSDLTEGTDTKTIIQGLVTDDGWPQEAAASFVEQVERERSEYWRQQRRQARRSGIAYDFIIGGGAFLLAGLFSLGSYAAAAPGETYWILVGPMVYGLWLVVRGSVRVIRR